MSPASQGGLQVEHYIGSSLISSSARVGHRGGYAKGRKDQNVLNHDYVLRHGRSGYPVPTLLSACDCTGYPYRPGPNITWAGLPLIAMPIHKHGKRGSGPNKGSPQSQPRKPPNDEERTPLSRLAIHTQGVPLILSGKCNNQRKPQLKNNREVIVRRNNKYKDGRGAVGPSDSLSVASDESSGSGNSENCLPRIIKPRKRRKKDRKPGLTSPDLEESVSPPIEVATRSQNGVSHDDPQLHHSFEDVAESEVVCPLSSCQCHYCDPSGIWDAPAPDLVLRRSWSEPLPNTPRPLQRSYSLRAPEMKDVMWESLKGCDISVKSPGPRTQCLEVSTEIVTSPNGHRDLEIRFYSASPTS